SRRDARLEVLDEDIGLAHEIEAECMIARLFEIERDAPLVAVPQHEGRALALDEGRHAPRLVALARPLDLDHIGAVIGENHRAIGAGEIGREIDDAHTLERKTRHCHSPDQRGPLAAIPRFAASRNWRRNAVKRTVTTPAAPARKAVAVMPVASQIAPPTLGIRKVTV